MLQKHYIGVNKKWGKTDAKTVDSVVIQNGGIPYHRYYGKTDWRYTRIPP